MTVLTFGSLFAGIGGFDLGLERAGMACKWQVEIDPFCLKVLTKHWPDVPKYEDVRDVGRKNLETVDLVAGGFPCQPHSVAGKRKGEADDRNLWPEFARVVTEIKPRWVVAENVPGIINTYLDTVLSDLERAGYTTGTLNIPAVALDARHRRERIFIVAYTEQTGTGDNHRATGRQRGQPLDTGEAGIRQRNRKTGAGGVDTTNRSVAMVSNTAVDGRDGRNGSHEHEREYDTVERGEQPVGDGGDGALANAERKRLEKREEGGLKDILLPIEQRGLERGGQGIWPPEPDVGRVVARVPPWLDGGRLNADAQSEGTKEILRALRNPDETQEIQWTAGGFGGVQAQEILFFALRQPTGEANPLGDISLESQETPQTILRSVWHNGKAPCPSCRRTAEEQRAREHSDIVYLLSQLLTCDCRTLGLDNTGTATAARNRVDRLRALGNAVVPQVAEFVGRQIVAVEEAS